MKSNLKAILDARGVSIREFARKIDYRYDSVRMLYNDEMERYPRELIARTCKALGVGVCDILTLE